MIGKLLGNLAPSITFEGAPAKVDSIEFRRDGADIVVRLDDGRRVRFPITVGNVHLVQE